MSGDYDWVHPGDYDPVHPREQPLVVRRPPEVLERQPGTIVVLDEHTMIFAYHDDFGEQGREWLRQQLEAGAPHIRWIVVPGPLRVIQVAK